MGTMKDLWIGRFDSIAKEIAKRTGESLECSNGNMMYYIEETGDNDIDRAAMFAVSYITDIIPDEDCLEKAVSAPAYYFDSNEDRIVTAWSVMLDYYENESDIVDDEIECFADYLEAATDFGGHLRPLDLDRPGEVEKFYFDICFDLPFDDALDIFNLYGLEKLYETAAG